MRENGIWEKSDDGDGVVCSICGEDFCTIIHETDRFKYCPNCGANMKKNNMMTLTEAIKILKEERDLRLGFIKSAESVGRSHAFEVAESQKKVVEALDVAIYRLEFGEVGIL